jgi:hypothetical protein
MDSVREMYLGYLKKGYTPKEAAKETQKLTGLSAVTGRPIKRKPKHKTQRNWIYGE